jgi:CBS domain-containing protein
MSEGTSTERSRLKCSEIMTTNVQTASRDTSLRDASVMMRDGDMGAVPVVDGGRLVGIVTDRDIVVRGLAEGKTADSSLGEVMSTDLVTVSPDSFVFEAIRLMGDKQIRRIPVADADGTLAGIISMADVALQTEDELEIAEAIEEISSGPGFWGKS